MECMDPPHPLLLSLVKIFCPYSSPSDKAYLSYNSNLLHMYMYTAEGKAHPLDGNCKALSVIHTIPLPACLISHYCHSELKHCCDTFIPTTGGCGLKRLQYTNLNIISFLHCKSSNVNLTKFYGYLSCTFAPSTVGTEQMCERCRKIISTKYGRLRDRVDDSPLVH